MATGVVVRIEKTNGYGFIQTRDGREIFFHQRWLREIKFREVKVGSILEFDIDQGKRGLRAQNIKFADDHHSRN